METGAVKENVKGWLCLEGLIVLLAALALYRHAGFGWGWFALFFMAPDLSMLAYLRGPRFGAWVYNAAHSYAAPAALLVAVTAIDAAAHPWTRPLAWQAALIWFAHIGFCRAAGFGLKYASGFDNTHLGKAPFNLPRFLAALLGKRSRIG